MNDDDYCVGCGWYGHCTCEEGYDYEYDEYDPLNDTYPCGCCTCCGCFCYMLEEEEEDD